MTIIARGLWPSIRALSVLFSLGVPQLALAQPFVAATYDGTVPTLEAVIGHKSGDKITSPDEILTYFKALQAGAPTRMTVTEYAVSWEGRPLVYAAISSPANMARLDEIKADMAQLASGEPLTRAQTDAIVARTPGVIWFAASVHGDEISPADTALAFAYHLLAAEGDPIVEDILANTIVIIDPSQNPDGRARFLNGFEAALGLVPQADRHAAEHDQPWPGGRYNHYLFDMNRDWFTLSQPETRGKVNAVMAWNPLIFVDSHEMGGDSTYYFPPAADPLNPFITDSQNTKQARMGRNRAAWFDRMGFAYFTREVYDAFYPGYGDTWPTLNGAIAQTFEQASARGLLYERSDGNELSFRDGVRHNFIAWLATAQTVAADKDGFLRDFAEFRRTGISEGAALKDRFVIMDLSVRRWQAEQLGRRLAAQGIAVSRLDGAREICRVSYPEGVLVVDKAQPNGRLIRTLLEADTPLSQEFVAAQEDRRARDLAHELYDVTAWSLPLMDGVNADSCNRVDLGTATRVHGDDPIPARVAGDDTFAIAVPWTDAGQAKLVIAALSQGLSGKTTNKAFTIAGKVYPKGTVIFPRAGNPADLGTTLGSLAGEIGATLAPLSSSWVDEGPNFGSSEFRSLKAPSVAMAWGEGMNPTATGATRYVIERQLDVPVTPIRLRTLADADLTKYDVIFLPDMEGELSVSAGTALKAFVERGGVLVAFEGALEQLSSKEIGLIATQIETAVQPETIETEASGAEEGVSPGLIIADEAAYKTLIADRSERPDDVPGALVNAFADPDHWMASGYDRAVALVTGTRVFRPINAADGINVFRFAPADELVASGYLWDENRLQLAYKPFVMAQPYGDGLVIGFTQSPTNRAYLNGLNLLVANAIVLSPAHIE